MPEKSYGRMIVEGFVRAIPWAVVFSAALFITMGVFAGMLKPEIKKAIVFAEQSAMSATVQTVLGNRAIKQNTKEAIEYTVKAVDREVVEPHKRLASANK